MDNGNGGSFSSLQGFSSNSLETTFTIATGIESGGMYRFRFRCLNINGWSSFSPITYITAATVPTRPPVPTFSNADSTSITLTLYQSTDSKGSPII